jgi:hypothetical protein
MTTLKLIADSGATKTAWRLLGGGKLKTFYTTGISPYHMTQEQIHQLLLKELPASIRKKSIGEIFYYGTGCKTKAKATLVAKAISSVFSDADVHVTHDLMGAALATCGKKPGIACILGTGSNSCYFDGKKIVSNSPGLGYVLGDEASGAYFGKVLIQHFLYKKFDPFLEKSFLKIFQTDKESILHHVYKEPFPNRYLATFSVFLSMHRGHYIIENIIEDGLREFFGTHLVGYPQVDKLPLHFVGGIAYHFKDKIAELCDMYGFKVGSILRHPIEGLSTFHQHASGKPKK